MQNTNTIIKKLDMYIPAAKIFQVLPSEENAIFLDSSLVNELGHYSIIGRKPYLKLEKREDRFYINDTEETSISFENYLRSYLDKQKTANSSHLPLASGALGYFSYEYGRRLMGIPSSHKDTISIPDAVLIFYDAFIIEDCHKKESYLITNGITEPADILLKKLEDAILKTSDSEPVKPVKEKYPIQVHANFEKEDYKKSISDMIHYIYEGDIYIANMTQQLTIESKKAPQDVFYNLRKNNPSPFGGYLDFDHYLTSHHNQCFPRQTIDRLLRCIENSRKGKWHPYQYPYPPYAKGRIYLDSMEGEPVALICESDREDDRTFYHIEETTGYPSRFR